MWSTDTIFPLVDAVRERLDIFGGLGLLLGFVAGAMPGRVGILAASAACAGCFGLHYLRLQAHTGAALCALSVMQGLVAARFGGAARRPAWFGPFFAAGGLAVLLLTAATWTGWPSACAGTGALLALRARFQGEVGAMRRNLIAASLAWAGHNLLVGSVFGLACDGLTLAGLLVALGREGAAPRAA